MPSIKTRHLVKEKKIFSSVHFFTEQQSRGRTVPISLNPIDHFTVVCLVTWPLNSSEAGVDLVLIQTSLFLLYKSGSSYANWFTFT